MKNPCREKISTIFYFIGQILDPVGKSLIIRIFRRGANLQG